MYSDSVVHRAEIRVINIVSIRKYNGFVNLFHALKAEREQKKNNMKT